MASTRERDEIRNILYDYLTYYVRVEERQSLNKNNNNNKKNQKQKNRTQTLYSEKAYAHRAEEGEVARGKFDEMRCPNEKNKLSSCI